jgi:hypothetical protein
LNENKETKYMKIQTGNHLLEVSKKAESLCAEWGFMVFASRKHTFLISEVSISRDGTNCLEELWKMAIDWLKKNDSSLDTGVF